MHFEDATGLVPTLPKNRLPLWSTAPRETYCAGCVGCRSTATSCRCKVAGFSRHTTPSRSGPSAGIGLYTGSRQREAT